MNRVLLILFLSIICFSSCKKGYDSIAEERTQADIDQKVIEDYIAATPGLGAKIKQVDSVGIKTGVYYVEEKAGTGNAIFTNSTRITIDYTSKILTTGVVFASSNNFHPSFTLGEVLRAWKLGIPNMKKGGRIRIIAASRYAYGPYDQPEIKLPANSVVDFDIELLDVTN
ncbi:FKBP-type peptidyl-prolyl cis-trans isomerase [Mucilaginibacter sp. RB4R14]|uniref:FKBP-type peptidyl-prolyl cis-trans isomerase n=1 Tax=Mucilaginibacter aurantiaciroseus TaxID=2949308 RepID=UPI002091BA82|nr:FKBP-type peptidyl-prolyl cis-trans isomerase [Mucilaginibacter aurantiaciroseus]MCO5934031.1 FKBP-type peptidyl-prolyl cis-trans isomerase [Mucilaginibacter aurantiaciroseus]